MRLEIFGCALLRQSILTDLEAIICLPWVKNQKIGDSHGVKIG
jgi:hypothetical protein